MEKQKKIVLPHSFYFYLVLRFLSAVRSTFISRTFPNFFQICCIIIIFLIGLSQYWTNRVSAVFGLVSCQKDNPLFSLRIIQIFVIVALLFSASAISILFIWDITTTTLVKVDIISRCSSRLLYFRDVFSPLSSPFPFSSRPSCS